MHTMSAHDGRSDVATARAGGAEACSRAVPLKFWPLAPPLVMMDTVKAYWEYLVCMSGVGFKSVLVTASYVLLYMQQK